jgi:integrase
VEVKRQVIEKDTKTHAERRLTLDHGSLDVLAAYREDVEAALAFAGVKLSRDAFVFSHQPDGLRPWRPNYVTLAFVRLARRECLEGLRLHDLRHFAATTMLVGGIDVRTAAGRLGHAQSSTTLDIYAHFVRAADERAAAAIGSALDAAAAGHTEHSPSTPGR